VRKLLLLRPEPGLSASIARAAEMGLEAMACPLFRIEPAEWAAPDASQYDALLLTSGNAARQAGPQLSRFSQLPVYVVGEATADAAESAGLHVVCVGQSDIFGLLAAIPDSLKLLHLAGEHRREVDSAHSIDRVTVYRSATIDDPALPALGQLVVAVHSPRAGSRLAELVGSRGETAIAAISAAAAEACGGGWERIAVSDRPDDSSLLALAASLCHTSAPR
jgi:uroporphyrinogen-III synthase